MTSKNFTKKDPKADNFVQDDDTQFRHRIRISSSVKVIIQQDLSILKHRCDLSFKPAQPNRSEAESDFNLILSISV